MYVSIIITTYNAKNYIICTLDAIRQQTYKLYEVLIVDDGSTDDTTKLVEQYIKDHQLDNFRIISLQHVGRSRALNHGIQSAQHDWVAILDADDLWHIKKLEIQIKYLKKYHLKCVATECVLFENNNEVDLSQEIKNDKPDDANLINLTLNTMLKFNVIPHSSILLAKELANYEEIDSQIDWALWLKLLHNGVKIHIINLNLTFHRIHSLQSFETRSHFKYVLIMRASVEILLSQWKNISCIFHSCENVLPLDI